MKNVTDSFVSLGHWPSAGSFGFDTDILAINPINLSVVILGIHLILLGIGAFLLVLKALYFGSVYIREEGNQKRKKMSSSFFYHSFAL